MGVFDPVIELGRGLGETLRSFVFERTVPFNTPKRSGLSARASVVVMC